MFCTKIKLLTQKSVFKVSLFTFLLVRTPVKPRNSQIYENCQTELLQFLSISFSKMKAFLGRLYQVIHRYENLRCIIIKWDGKAILSSKI